MTTINNLEEFAALVGELLNNETVSQDTCLEANKETLIHLISTAGILGKKQLSPEHVDLYLNEIRISAMGYTLSLLQLMQHHSSITAEELNPSRNLLASIVRHYVDQSIAIKEALLRSRKGTPDEEIPN